MGVPWLAGAILCLGPGWAVPLAHHAPIAVGCWFVLTRPDGPSV